MANPRPFQTFYSHGGRGRATTATKAAQRAFKTVLEGTCRTAQVYSPQGKRIVQVERLYNTLHVTISKKDFK
jgi:hypothetical protein